MKTDGSHNSMTTARLFRGNAVKITAQLMVVAAIGLAGGLYSLKQSIPAHRDGSTISAPARPDTHDQWWTTDERKTVTASVEEPAPRSSGARRRGQEGGLLGDVGVDQRMHSFPIRIPLSTDARRRGQEGGLLGQ